MSFAKVRMVPGQEVVFLHGKRRISKVNDNGTVVLVCPLTGDEVQTSLPALLDLRLEGKMAPAEGSDADAGKYRRKASPIDKHQEALVARRIAYVNSLNALGHIGPKHPSVAHRIEEVARRIGDKAPPKPWTTYRWLRRYRNSGFNPDVLARDALFVRKRKEKVPLEIKEAIKGHVLKLMSAYLGASLHSVTNLALALTARDFDKEYFLAVDGQRYLALTFISAAEEVLRKKANEHRERNPVPERGR